MSARPGFTRFRPFISLAQKLAGVGGPRREVVFSDRRLLATEVSASARLELRLGVDAERLARAGVAFDARTARAFALVPREDGTWRRVELDAQPTTDEGETPAVVFSGQGPQGDEAAAVWRDGVAFGLEVPGYEATTTVWAQRPGENARPLAR